MDPDSPEARHGWAQPAEQPHPRHRAPVDPVEGEPVEGVLVHGAPTQVAAPWRATVRTLAAAVIGFAGVWGVVVEAAGLDPNWGWVSVSLAVTGAVTRAMAHPLVNAWIERHVPWLAPEGLLREAP